MKNTNILQTLKHQLIVSCQTSVDNPLCTAEHMALLAQCSSAGGCRYYRVDTPAHIQAIKAVVPDALIIGIWKVEYPNSDVFITPTMNEVRALVNCGADIIATDGTHQVGPSGEPGYKLIEAIRKEFPDHLIMADVATYEDAEASYQAGADIISTTLRGYTKDTDSLSQSDCDIEFIKKLHKTIPCYLIAEGKLWTKEDACKALQAGADSIVIGTAINNPKCITERYINAIKEVEKP